MKGEKVKDGEFPDISSTRLKAQELHNSIHQFRELLQVKHGWRDNDARLTVFSKLMNVLMAFMLGLVFIERHLLKREWWTNTSNIPFSDEQASRACSEFEMFLRIGLIQNGLYATESSFRIFVLELNSQACGGATATLESVSKWLLSRLQLTEFSALFDLWRAVRNTMHNNGLYRPTSRTDREIVYKGKVYSLRYGEPLDFVTTDFVVSLLADAVVALARVLEAEELARLPFCEETT